MAKFYHYWLEMVTLQVEKVDLGRVGDIWKRASSSLQASR